MIKTNPTFNLSDPKPESLENLCDKQASGSYASRENQSKFMRMNGTSFKDIAMKPMKRKGNRKPKLNVSLREITIQRLAALAELEKRSVSNLIEVMADERWEELAKREGVDWAKTVAEIAGLDGLSADQEADRKVFRREILDRALKFKKS